VTGVRSPHRPRRRLVRLAALAAAASLAAACTGGGDEDVTPTTSVAVTTTTAARREADGRLVMGVYLPQTGPGASLGQSMISAVRGAVAHINAEGGVLGNDIELLVLDEGAPSGPSALLAEGVDAIIGPASSRNALSQLASIVRADTGVVTCSPTATALALDAFPDNGYFFRTVPSDSLQMVAIARRAERTGVPSVAVGYLDDPYGRGLADALVAEIVQRRRQDVIAEVAFGADQEDLRATVSELLADAPGLVIVLGDADDGGRLLAALDAATPDDVPQVIVNDAIRTAASIQQLSPRFRTRLTGVAPRATNESDEGFFTAHAIDCVNLIALATAEAGTDAPSAIRLWMAPVSGGGRQCSTFEDCIALLEQGLQIDYNGLSGAIELSSTTGDTTRASFVQFGFDADGTEIDTRVFEAP
jgi:branched-chain amino acid transport system substrate-binding protein